jgi:hypothetical protein
MRTTYVLPAVMNPGGTWIEVTFPLTYNVV